MNWFRPTLYLIPCLAMLGGVGPALPGLGGTAFAQSGQQWFVPQQPAQPRPAQPPQQRRPAPAAAAMPGPVIGIVDIQEVQRLSVAFTQLREEIERRRVRLNEDLQREQTAWRDAQQQLAARRGELSAEQIRGRERELQERITEAQRVFRNRGQHIEAAAQQALMQFEERLAQTVGEVAQGRNVNIVLPRPLVIMNDPTFELTEEIAQQMNRTLRSVEIPPEHDGSTPPEQPAEPAAPGAPAAPAAPAPRR